MIAQIMFTVVAFVLFIYILLLKMIKKNDTTYLIILGIQAIGILVNLIKITFDVFYRTILYGVIIFIVHNNTGYGFRVGGKKYKCIRNIKDYYGTNAYMDRKYKKG